MSIATRAVNDYRRCQQQCDVAATIRDRSNNGRYQRQRTVPATTNDGATIRDASNHELCLRPWAMPTTMRYSSNNPRCQQPRAMSIATPMVATASDVRTTGDASSHGWSSNYTRDSHQQYMIATTMRAMTRGVGNNARC